MYTLLKVRALETIACILVLYILSSGMTRIVNGLKNFFMVSINHFKILIKSWEYNKDYMWPAIPKIFNILPLHKRCSDIVKSWATNKIISFALLMKVEHIIHWNSRMEGFISYDGNYCQKYIKNQRLFSIMPQIKGASIKLNWHRWGNGRASQAHGPPLLAHRRDF